MRTAIQFVIGVLLFVGAAGGQPAPEAARDPGWPREYKADDGTLVILYQPQLQSWTDFERLDALIAVAVRMADDSEHYGALSVTASTATDHEQRTVKLTGLSVTEVAFPGLDDVTADDAERVLRSVVPPGTSIDLDLLLADLERDRVAVDDVRVANDPPRVILSYTDALLVLVDGEPAYEPVEDLPIEIVVNTASDVFRDPATGMFYLMRGVNWLEAPALDGPWTVNRLLPEPFYRLPDTPRLHAVRLGARGRRISALMNPPAVYVSLEPAELIVVYGEPELERIPDTGLDFVVNTESDVFKYDGDGLYYVLFAGRWFKTAGRDAPLEFCTPDLPDDFARIPASHPAGRVLVSVPGTAQAEEAVIASRIPRTAIVDRDVAAIEVTYVGEPDFVQISGTDVKHAANTSTDVFLVESESTPYYACSLGVWFEASAPGGPWTVCDTVPPALHQLPPNTPAYPVVFVKVLDATDDEVTVGYLPGYENTFVSGGVVVHGLGYDYELTPPYYVDRYRRWDWRHQRFHRLHDTYGYGYHYDHLSGRYRRNIESRRHQAAREAFDEPYDAWDKGVAPTAYTAQRGAEVERRDTIARGRAARGFRPDIYAAAGGQVYRLDRGGAWQRHERRGWSPEVSMAAQRSLERSARARQDGGQRVSQHAQYRASRGRGR